MIKPEIVRDGDTLQIHGDLIFDVPYTWRQEVIDALDTQAGTTFLDLTGITRLGYWGEQKIKSVVRRCGIKNVLIDDQRMAQFSGLRIGLSMLGVEPLLETGEVKCESPK